MFNPFIGWSKTDLEIALRAAQNEYAAGVQIASVGAGDTNVSGSVQVTILERIRQIYQALFLIDPVTYPIDKITPIDRTHFLSPQRRQIDVTDTL